MRLVWAATGTQTFQSVRPAELHSAAEQKKADRMSAWRTGHKPVFRFASTFLEPLEVHGSRPRAIEVHSAYDGSD
jgi:hypothetical protein